MERVNTKVVAIALFTTAFFILILSGEDCDECFSLGAMAGKIFLVGLVFFGASFYFSRKWAKTDSILYKITRQPLQEIATITEGVPAAFIGKINCEEPLVSPYTKTPCVFYHFVEEQYVRSDKSSYWKVVKNVADHCDFSIADKTGQIGVNLRNIDSDLSKFKLAKGMSEEHRLPDYDNSEIDAVKKVFQQPFMEEKPFLGIFRSKIRKRASEYVLEPGEEVFAYGWVYGEEGKKVVAEAGESPLIISRKKKEDYIDDFSVGESFFYTNNLFLFIGITCLWLPFYLFYGAPLLILLGAYAIISVKMIIEVYNRMVALRRRIDNAKSQISIELEKRFDLIPNLEKTVKAYARFEKGMLEFIARIRAEIALTGKGMREYAQQEKQLDKTLIALAEKYPELRASELFADFINRLRQIEENIAYYRGFYNKTVLKYNTLIAIFPFNLLASIARFREAEFWKLEEKA